MKSLITTELAPEVFAQGLGLQRAENFGYTGKIGRHEVILISREQVKDLEPIEEEVQIVYLGLTGTQNQFRPGDILMAGSDELLDKTFKALDELELRGVVVTLEPPGEENQMPLDKAALQHQVHRWKEYKHPFLCLFMVNGEDMESQAMLITAIRKIIND